MMVWKMIFLQGFRILRFHVNLPGCSSNFAAEKMEAKLSSCPVVQIPDLLFCWVSFFWGADSLAADCTEGCHASLPLGFDVIQEFMEVDLRKNKKNNQLQYMGGVPAVSRWWFEIFFIFTPSWGRFPFWLTFSDGLKPVMQSFVGFMWEVDSNYTSNHQGGDTVPIFFGTTYASMATLGN